MHGHVRDKQDHIAQIHPEMLCKRPHPLILEQKPGYQQWIAEDPLEFLNQIEQACISYQENDYPSAAYWKVIERTITLKQGPNKTVSLYATRFENQWKIFYMSIHWIIIGLEHEDEMNKLTVDEHQ